MRESLFESHALAGRPVLTSEHVSRGTVVRAPGGTLLVHPATLVRFEQPRDPAAQLEGSKVWHQRRAAKRFDDATDRLHREGVPDRMTIAHSRLARYRSTRSPHADHLDAMVRAFLAPSIVDVLAQRLRP